MLQKIQILIIFLTDKINILLYPVSCYFSVYFSPSILTINFYKICHQKDGISTLGTIPPTAKYTYPYITFTMQFFFIHNDKQYNKNNKFTCQRSLF